MHIHSILINGNDCTSKQDLFNTFKSALDFPDYFANNWDSFEEIIHDLHFSEKTFILISDYKNLLSESMEDKKIFSEIIRISNLENDYQFYKIKSIEG